MQTAAAFVNLVCLSEASMSLVLYMKLPQC